MDNWPLSNKVLDNPELSMEHLSNQHKEDLFVLLKRHSKLSKDPPGRTRIMQHDVDAQGTEPIKQAPYRLNSKKVDNVRKEVWYMLGH